MLVHGNGLESGLDMRANQHRGNLSATVSKVGVHGFIPSDYQNAVAEIGAFDQRINVGLQPGVSISQNLGVSAGGQARWTIVPVVLRVGKNLNKVCQRSSGQVGRELTE